MLNISLDWYKCFYEVAKSKSYTDASNKMFVTKQAVTDTIKKLESGLDTKLFHRSNNGVKLTKEGEELLNYIEKALDLIEVGEKLVVMKNDLDTGEITIGSLSHISAFYLMPYIEKVRKEHKGLNVKLITAPNGKELIRLLEEHKIDFAVDTTKLDNYSSQIIKEKIKDISNIFISNKPIEIKDLKELENYNFILGLGYTSTSKRLISTLKENGINIKSKTEIDITELKINAVKRGMGIGYVLKDAVKNELKNKEVFEVKIPIELPTSSLNLIYLKDQLTRVDKTFINEYLGLKTAVK